MQKKETINERHKAENTAGGSVYLPFQDGEIVTSVLFSEPTKYAIKTVEGFATVSSGTAKSVAMEMIETVCLVVETEKAVTINIFTIK